MPRYPILSIVLLSTLCALRGDVFQIGQTQVNIPAPEGYVRVTEQMPQMHQLLAAIEDTANDTLAVYITPEAAQSALDGEIPALERYFVVKVGHGASEALISTAEFKKVRVALAAQQEEVIEAARKRLPELMARIDQKLADGFENNVQLQSIQMIPLGVVRDDQDAFAFSLLVSFEEEAEGVESGVFMATCTIVNVSGKVISLYAYGAADDLKWTRESSAAWMKIILAVNAPAPETKLFGMNISTLVWVGGGLFALVAMWLGGRERARRKTPL